MKSFKLLFLSLFTVMTTTAFSQTEQTDTIKVYGNCGMCKNRIEKAIKESVTKADWDSETKLLVVTYDTAKISNLEIQKRIAAVGHDTEKFRADDKVYGKLPGCCLYDRKKED